MFDLASSNGKVKFAGWEPGGPNLLAYKALARTHTESATFRAHKQYLHVQSIGKGPATICRFLRPKGFDKTIAYLGNPGLWYRSSAHLSAQYIRSFWGSWECDPWITWLNLHVFGFCCRSDHVVQQCVWGAGRIMDTVWYSFLANCTCHGGT